MNLELYRVLFADRELAEAQALIVELRHSIDQLDLAIANYQDAFTSLQERTS